MSGFPIMGDFEQVGSIPWEVIAPHEAQAMRNHGQTLNRLAERGGLSPFEAIAVMTDRIYYDCNFPGMSDRTSKGRQEFYQEGFRQLRELLTA